MTFYVISLYNKNKFISKATFSYGYYGDFIIIASFHEIFFLLENILNQIEYLNLLKCIY